MHGHGKLIELGGSYQMIVARTKQRAPLWARARVIASCKAQRDAPTCAQR
jgi:hypothetical protein